MDTNETQLVEACEKGTSSDNEGVLKEIAEIKSMIKSNETMSRVVDTEPRKVLSKLYIEGTPAGLKNIIQTIIGAYGYDEKGNSVTGKGIAVTLMIEDLTKVR